MTEVNLSPTVDGYRGAIGKLVFKKYKGRTIVCRKPTFTKPPSAAQIAEREHFKEAVAYAQSVLADPAACEFYGPIAKEKDTSVYWLAIKDFRKKPSIQRLDLSRYKGRMGDIISIRAVDDIGLAEIELTLTADDGTEIEKGKAVEDGIRTGHWTYTVTTPVALGSDIFVNAVGFDHAGTKVELSESSRVGAEE